MSKELKKLVVKELKSNYQDVNNFIVIKFKGISALQANTLRRDLSENDIRMRVVKNSLVSITFKELGIPALGQMLEGPSAIATSNNGPIALIKVLTKWSEKIKEFQIIGGLMDGRLLSVQDIKTLSSIPSKEVLLTQILFAIRTPITQLANVFNAVINNLYFVLSEIKDKKEND